MDADARRSYADHLRDWENARPTLAEGRALLVPDEFGTVSFSDLAVFFFKHGAALLDAAENLLDATAYTDQAALRRQTEIVQALGREREEQDAAWGSSNA